MKSRVQEKEKAIELRKRGYSYNEIVKELGVAKSNIALWLKEYPLEEEEKRALRERKEANMRRARAKAVASNRMRRIVREGFFAKDAKQEFEKYSSDPFFCLGLALYMGEGAHKSWGFSFTSSNKETLILMLNWIEAYFFVKRGDLGARLFCPEGDFNEEYWGDLLRIPKTNFKRTIYETKKRGEGHRGSVRLELTKATYLRKMLLWQHMLFERYENYDTLQERP